MRDVPPVTLGHPADRRAPWDLLVGGDDREQRLSRRTRVLAGTGLALVVAGVAAGTAYAQHRTEQQQAAAFAFADRVHVQGVLTGVFGLETGSGRIGASVELTATDGAQGSQSVPTVRLEGPGLQPLVPGGPGRFTSPYSALPESRVSCRAAAAGQVPDSAEVVVTVVPASQVPHEQRLPVDAEALREAVLSACDLPDPDAAPYVEVSGRGDTVLVLVETVRRSDMDVQLVDVRTPGLSLELPAQGPGLPRTVAPDSGAFFAFEVRVVDCAAAQIGPLEVTVVLSEDGQREERPAPAAVRQPQPDTVPVARLLERLVDRAC